MNDRSNLLSETPDAVCDDNTIVVCALYKFIALPDYQALQAPMQRQLNQHAVRGTLLLAEEGINGTISGSQENIDAILNWLQRDARFESLDYKLSYHSEQPFHRTKVKLKKEIVTMGVAGVNPNKVVGTYIEPTEWNALISDPDTVLIDTRNEYEVGIGSFKHALNPNTQSFREFPAYVQKHFDRTRHKKVAMFCTGGIRCEKASAYMKEQGFDEVYHLKGGILKYLETVDEKESLWNGECFVFDERVAVNHALEKGQYDQCHACRYPITAEDKCSKHYLPGVSCPRCYQQTSENKKRRFKERERQVQLAKQRGEAHIGSDSRLAAYKNRLRKQAKKLCQGDNNKAELRT